MILPEERVKSYNKAIVELKKLEKEYKAATTDQDRVKLTALGKKVEFTVTLELNTLNNAIESAWREVRKIAKAMNF